ncbi:hypothetical protein MKZ21_30590 [Paenibacillus sp. FSL P2-0536]|uniref:hypothetical protein n=1 Tax=Paenibacillus sp. FSL P2-0536 TaxID=2921629 RepID=UPI0030F4DBF8
MDVSLLIKKVEEQSATFKTLKEYDTADAFRELAVEIEQGKYYGSIYKQFIEWTSDDVCFTDHEKQKILYLLVKKHPRTQQLSSPRSFGVHDSSQKSPCTLQTTINENPDGKDEVHVVINGGHGYNEFGTEKFMELLTRF